MVVPRPSPSTSLAQPGQPPDHVAGPSTKRKAASAAIATESSPGRVTRRSVAQGDATRGRGRAGMDMGVAGPSQSSPGAAIGLGSDEGAVGSRRTKRARRSSPPTSSAISNGILDHAHPSSSLATLDPALTDSTEPLTSNGPPPIPRALPYPMGLTPFRFPCTRPDQSPPPPGDPHAPGFKPFNPHFDAVGSRGARGSKASPLGNPPPGANAVSAGSELPSTSSRTPPPPPPAPQPHAPVDPLPENNFAFPLPGSFPDDLHLDAGVDFLSDPAYASIAALLSASQSQLPGSSGPEPPSGEGRGAT